MNWEGFTQWLTNVTTNPAFIAVVTILSAFGSILIVISKTSIGKKAINQMMEISRGTNKMVSDTCKKMEEKKEELTATVKKYKEDLNRLSENLENKYKLFVTQFDFYENQMYEILKLIPNNKVQEQLKEFKSTWDDKKKEIQQFLGSTYSDEINELKSQIQELKAELSHDNKGTEE